MLTHEQLLAAIPHAVETVDLPNLGVKRSGKVRDIYHMDGSLVLIATDRMSGFDRVLTTIPYKGQVLNQLSAWWFEQTRHIIANHVIAVPDPNVTIAQTAASIPVEVIVRGYITGVTKTSLWYLYQQGERQPYGICLPDGLHKNDRLPYPIITPTTKASEGSHDEQITSAGIIERGLVSAELWAQIETVALQLFAHGQQLAEQAGLILVDTKYEFGLLDGQLILIDELHTPDSSRFWLRESYISGTEPENYDKEYLRIWYVGQGYRGEGTPPVLPAEIVTNAATRYIRLYEQLAGTTFVPGEQPAVERIAKIMFQAKGKR